MIESVELFTQPICSKTLFKTKLLKVTKALCHLFNKFIQKCWFSQEQSKWLI